MAGKKGRSGNQGWKKNFDMACMLGTATGILENFLSIGKKEIDLSEEEKERRRVAIEVFKKLAPSNINVGGQKDNPLGITLEIVLNEDRAYKEADQSI